MKLTVKLVKKLYIYPLPATFCLGMARCLVPYWMGRRQLVQPQQNNSLGFCSAPSYPLGSVGTPCGTTPTTIPYGGECQQYRMCAYVCMSVSVCVRVYLCEIKWIKLPLLCFFKCHHLNVHSP